MKNEKKNSTHSKLWYNTIVENQNNNKQWNCMLSDLQINKLETLMLELQNPYYSKKKHTHLNDNSQQPKIHELFDV
jgi:hypothetical protein